MSNVFELKPCIAIVTGTENDHEPQTMEFDQDEIWCNGKRVGFVTQTEGAVCRIHRVLSQPTKVELQAAVAKLRQEQGKPGISERVSCLVDPVAIKGALNNPTKRKR